MAVVYSKLLWNSLPYRYTCHELGHAWEPSCLIATKDVMFAAFRYSIKLYVSLYLLTAVWKRRPWKYYKERLLVEILRSTIFLTSNGFLFIFFFCLTRHMTGKIFMFTSSYIPAVGACFLSIMIERKQRRSILALYFTNLASELIFNMLSSRGILHPVPYAEVAMFCLSSAGYMYMLRCSNDLDKSTVNGLKFLLGNGVTALGQNNNIIVPPASRGGAYSPCSTSSNGAPQPDAAVSWRDRLGRAYQRLKRKVSFHLAHNDHACQQDARRCAVHAAIRTARSVALGYALNLCLSTLSGLARRVSAPRTLLSLAPLRHLLSASHWALAAFAGSYTGIYWVCRCVMNRVLPSAPGVGATVAGALAGTSMLAYRSASVSLYLLWNLIEVIYFKYAAKGYLPTFKHADIIIYTLSMSVLFHAAVFEPHNIRSTYWRFLVNLTAGRFHDMNRKLLDVYGTHASKLYANKVANYKIRHIVHNLI